MAVMLLSGILLLAASVAAIYVVFRFGRFVMGLVTNLVLGFISIFIVNALFGMAIIPYDIPVYLITVVFGVFGVVALLALNLLGIRAPFGILI